MYEFKAVTVKSETELQDYLDAGWEVEILSGAQLTFPDHGNYTALGIVWMAILSSRLAS